MDSGIYKIVNKIDDKLYVGSAKNFEKRWDRHKKDLLNNRHSSIKLQRAYNKHGVDSFTYEIIEEVEYTKDLFIAREQYYIDTLDSKLNGYNIADASFGDVLSNHPNKIAICKQISETLKHNNSKLSEAERKAKWSQPGELNGMYGKTHTPETRKFLSENSSGRPSPIKGMHFDDFMEPAACAARKEELSKQAKLRTGDKNSFYGKTHSEEAKRLMSENGKGSIPPNRVPVVIDNVRYETVHHAGIALDINPATVRWRIYSKNKKFANYCLHEE